MKKAATLLALLALSGSANAANTNNVQDENERGIDCDGVDNDAGGGTARQCDCRTDLDRTWNPPRLINTNVNRVEITTESGVTRETGIVRGTNGNAADLEIAIRLDGGVYVGGYGTLRASEFMTPASSTSPDNAYTDPSIWFVHQADGTYAAQYPVGGLGGTDYVADSEIPICKWTTTGTDLVTYGTDKVSGGGDDVTVDQGLVVERITRANSASAWADSTASTFPAALGVYGTSDECLDTEYVVSARIDVRTALRECGFTASSIANSAVPAEEQKDGNDDVTPGTADGPTASSSYTQFLGKLKVQQTRQNGALRTQEVVLKEDYPFQITILFPENIEVTSQTISVIGQAEYASTITHQIFNSGSEHVDVNALFGTTYPYAITPQTLTTTGDTKTFTSELIMFDGTADPTGPCQYFVPYDDATYDAKCRGGSASNPYPTAQSTTNYRADILCDLSDDGTAQPDGACTIFDVFTLTQAPETPYVSDSNAFNTESPGGTSLPDTRCIGINQGTTNQKACLQNTHFRLKPKGWCDVTAKFNLTVNAVCRDDLNGDGSHVSIVQDSWSGGYVSDPRSGDAQLNHLATGSTRLFQPVTGATLPCSSQDYRDSLDPRHTITFSLASDDFCARVIATGDISRDMAIYDSEFGVATWGADIAALSTTAATSTAGVRANIDTSFAANANSASCTASTSAITNSLCNQVPLFETGTDGLAARSTQGSFVFGTTAYLETYVYANAGVNIDDTTITSLFVSNKDGLDASTLPATGTSDGVVADANAQWTKQLFPGSADEKIRSYLDSTTVDPTTTNPGDATIRVTISDDITTNSMLGGGATNTDLSGWFTTNPSSQGTNGAKLGPNFEGVSRASVLMDEYTVYITDYDLATGTDVPGEVPENIVFYANIAITYEAAADQNALGAREVTTSATVPSSKVDRARSLAAGAVTGGQASATASVGRTATAGSSGASSNIAGMSATTVLAAASVLGAVVVAAGASFFVVRKRRAAAARTAKRSSSSTELNDTLAVQA